ncbi:MAG TPA: phosphatidylglycerol lysyltransferase domain-containing protein [Solirubrobacteraceae bacterium]|nr:phosphatidylglycerol lysyltransferase domain-containing protein [Solirubrobacteraceae bacterium]
MILPSAETSPRFARLREALPLAKVMATVPAWVGAALTALVALVNIASALTPDIHWRGHLLLHLEGVGTVRFFHALALPAGTALLLSAPYLFKRRRRALQVAVTILVLAGVVNVLKGLDVEECLAGWTVAAILLASRRRFDVVPAPVSLRSALWRVPLVGALGIALITLADWIANRHRTHLGSILSESGVLLQGRGNGPQRFELHTATILHHHFRFAWIPLGVHFLEVGTLLAIAYLIFRPLAVPRTPPGELTRSMAAEVVRAHGSDTLSFFKLRSDNLFYFTEDRSAFVGYQVDSRVLILSGDPVGPPERFGELLAGVQRFARARGLKLGAVGASARMREHYAALGMPTMYIGDEAIVSVDDFSLEGRAIRKVRQSVNRLAKNGYSAEMCGLADLDANALAEIERVIVLGRQGKPEMGFSMGMDSIHGVNDADTLFLLARDADGVIRAFLHLVPCYGRSAVSLSLMRRDPATPNGLMEFLIVHGIEALRERGVKEFSLNFAFGARWIHGEANPVERSLGKLVLIFDNWLQLESLYRFNVKFNPRWEPRYLAFAGWPSFPRTAMASVWLEGQMPKPRLPRAPRIGRARYIGSGAAGLGSPGHPAAR